MELAARVLQPCRTFDIDNPSWSGTQSGPTRVYGSTAEAIVNSGNLEPAWFTPWLLPE